MGMLLQGYQLYISEGLEPCMKISNATNSYESENDRYELFLADNCVARKGNTVSVTVMALRFMEWSKHMFGATSILYKDSRRYTSNLTKTLESNSWNIKKKQLAADGNRFHYFNIELLPSII